MRKILLILLSLSCVTAFAQVNTNKWVTPPFTSVDKLSKLKNGMSIAEVNATLGIPPYDMYFLQQEGGAVLTYNYRLQLRRNELPSTPQKQEDFIRSEQGQTGGQVYYQKEFFQAYILFRDGKMSSLVTTEGVLRSEYILTMNNNLRVLSKADMKALNIKKSGDAYLINNKDTVFLFKTIKVPDAPKPNPVIQARENNSGKTLVKACASLVLLSGLITLIVVAATY